MPLEQDQQDNTVLQEWDFTGSGFPRSDGNNSPFHIWYFYFLMFIFLSDEGTLLHCEITQEDKLHPCVGLRTQAEEVVGNFGGQPFVADFESVLTAYRRQVRHSPIQMPGTAQL